MKYKFLEHTADIKFKAYGKTLDECFENAVLAFSDFVSSGNNIKSEKRKKINVKGTDEENLLYLFLEELIYLLDRGFVVKKANVKISGNKAQAIFYGDDVSRYKNLEHIKAVTYSEMYVKKKLKVWEVQVVLDV